MESCESRTSIKERFSWYYDNLERFAIELRTVVQYFATCPACLGGAMFGNRRSFPAKPTPARGFAAGDDGIAEDSCVDKYGDFVVREFNYFYVGLPGLDALEYINSEHILGAALAALMPIPPERRARLKAESLQRIAKSQENTQNKYLLAECVEACLTLEEPQEQEEFDKAKRTRKHKNGSNNVRKGD